MANHIKYIDIHKFKGIKDINIYDMKSINIFVGDNNSGKTTILEAIKFFEKPFDYLSHMVKRIRNTTPQKELNDVERKANLKKAFQLVSNIVK